MQQAGPVPLLERVQALTSLEYRPVDRGEEIYLVIGVSMQEVKNPADKLFNQVVGAFLGTLDGLTGGVSTFIVNWAGKRLKSAEFPQGASDTIKCGSSENANPLGFKRRTGSDWPAP